MARTPLHSFRVSDELWAEWQERATAAGVSIASLIVEAMALAKKRQQAPPIATDEASVRGRTAERMARYKIPAGFDPPPREPTIVHDDQPTSACTHPRAQRKQIAPYAFRCLACGKVVR